MNDDSRQPVSQVCYCVGIALLGETLVRGDHPADHVALACAAMAIVVVALPLLLPERRISGVVVDGLIAVGVAIGFCRLPYLNLFFEYPKSRPLLMPFIVLASVAALLATLVLLRRPRAMVGGVFALLLLDVGLMGVFHLNISASPKVDVYLAQDLGCSALIHGRDPFAMTFPDIYGPGAGFYPRGAVVNGQVQSGYFYPPLSLLVDLPGYLLGDLRYSHLVAVLVAAGLLGYARRNFAPAVWLLFTPKLLFILENAWIETYAALMLALVVWAAARREWLLMPIAVGLLLVTKQYLLLTIPAAVLLLPLPWRWRESMRFAAIALLAGSVVTLPFILWNPSAFFHSMTFLFRELLREDSISFLPVVSRAVGTRLTLICPLLAAVVPAALVLRPSRHSAAGFAAGVALICLCVFIFSTQAFINYYFFSVGALCAAMAAEDGGVSSREDMMLGELTHGRVTGSGQAIPGV